MSYELFPKTFGLDKWMTEALNCVCRRFLKMYPYPFFIAFLALLLFSSSLLKADGPIQVTGGLSPNGKLAVVVKRDEDTSQASVSSDNTHPLLENVSDGKIIGPLEEVDTIGGGFGHVLANLTAYWSPNNSFLAIRFRAGRLNEDYVIYSIKRSATSYRAVPQKLPNAISGPNGAKIFAQASHAANMGDIFEAWLSPTEFAITKYRYFPPYPPASEDVDYFNGNGAIEVHCSYGPHGWMVSSYKKPPE